MLEGSFGAFNAYVLREYPKLWLEFMWVGYIWYGGNRVQGFYSSKLFLARNTNELILLIRSIPKFNLSYWLQFASLNNLQGR